MTPAYMTTSEAAIHLRFVDKQTGAPDLKRLWAYVHKHLPADAIRRRGRTLLIKTEAIEASLRRTA